MPDSVVQQIKDRLDIVEIVSSYLKLEKTGINYRAPCPFHSEKKPSFFVSPSRQMFKCFGCNASGSVFDFIMQIEGIEFGDALKILARRAGVELKEFSPELKTKRQRLYEICELSSSFYEQQLKSATGKKVIDYLNQRGIKQDTLLKWRLGYSPSSWRSLLEFLISKGYEKEEITEAGLVIKSDKGCYDRFRGRIMFPVFDINSQVVGFGGRVFEGDDAAKYLNIQNTPLYDKSRTLYGLNFGKMDIRKKDYCILTEGYTDVILSHQFGFENTVAASGTSLTPLQLKILKRYTNNLFFAFDMDPAGAMATKRGIDLAQKEDFNIKVIVMRSGQDPADIISTNPKDWQKAIDSAKDIMDFYFQDALSKFDAKTPTGKKDISSMLLPQIRKLPSKILQSHWAKKLSSELKVAEEAVLEELKKISLKKEDKEEKIIPKENKGRSRLLEEKIVSLVLKAPENLEYVDEEDITLFSADLNTILTCFKKEKDVQKALDKLGKQEALKNTLESLSFKAEIDEEEDLDYEFQVCLSCFRDITLQEKLKNIAQEISKAEINKDEKKIQELMTTFNQLVKSQ